MVVTKRTISYTTGALFVLTILSGLILSSSSASADNSAAQKIRVIVPTACNLTTSNTTAHTATIDAGTYRADIGESTITATCNDAGGFAIYAIGYSGDTHGNNTLINTTNENQTIASGTATSGATSNWAMKLTAVTGTYEPTIESAFQGYTTIPTTYTKVASLNSTTDQSTGANFKSTYAAYIASTQPAGTYRGKVKYTLVHPATHTAPNSRPALLDTGQNVNAKMKSLAATVANGTETTKTYTDTDTLIKSIQTSNSLPVNFEATEANTISLTTSERPVYIYFDNTNNNGIMYVYSGEGIPVMNPDSSSLFSNLRALSSAPAISSWDTSSVTNMSGMFSSAGYSATSFSLDLSSWDTSGVENMSSIFSYVGYSAADFSITGLSSWDTSSVIYMNRMFGQAGYNATSFVFDLSSWDTSSAIYMNSLFEYAGYSATTWSIGNLSSWDTSNVENMGSMFFSAAGSVTTWSIGDISKWDVSKVKDMNRMFQNVGYDFAEFSLDLSSWDTSSVKNMSKMFYATGFAATDFSLNISSWDTSQVTDMSHMFEYTGNHATNFSLNISSWDTSSVANMSYMFQYAGYNSDTFSLDLSSWNTSIVTNMSYMFAYAGQDATTFSLNLSGWDTSGVTSMSNMFKYDSSTNATWSVTIPNTNGNGTNNTTSRMYGKTTSTYTTPRSSKSFTLAQ